MVAERAAFWQPLAEDTDRAMTIELASGELPVRVSGADLAACMDILLENVFARTPDGAALAIRLSRRAGGGAWLMVADDGPGFRSPDATERGRSSGGSTGLGLDIDRRIAESSGGTLTVGRSVSGGGSVTVGLGPTAGPVDTARGHRRTRTGRSAHHDATAHPGAAAHTDATADPGAAAHTDGTADPDATAAPMSYFWADGE